MNKALLYLTLLSSILVAAPAAYAQDSTPPDEAEESNEAGQERELKNRLETIKVTLEVKDATLAQLIELIHTKTDIGIFISPDAYGEKSPDGFKLSISVIDLPLDALIDYINSQFKLKSKFVAGMIILQSANKKEDADKLTQMHYIKDLLYVAPNFQGPELNLNPDGAAEAVAPEPPKGMFEDTDKLIEMIKTWTGGKAAWDDTGATIYFASDYLIVDASKELQAKVVDFLNQLRTVK